MLDLFGRAGFHTPAHLLFPAALWSAMTRSHYRWRQGGSKDKSCLKSPSSHLARLMPARPPLTRPPPTRFPLGRTLSCGAQCPLPMTPPSVHRPPFPSSAPTGHALGGLLGQALPPGHREGQLASAKSPLGSPQRG